jgi:diguanylate cyclase (GGDEF)-like protein
MYSYHPNLVRHMVDQTQKAIFGLITVSLIYLWAYWDYIPLTYLLTWLVAQIIFIFFRFKNAKILKDAIDKDDTTKIQRNITYFSIFIFYSTLVWTSATILGLIYAPPSYAFISAIMIVGIVTAGSLSLSSIYYIYNIYFFLMLIPQIIIMFYYGEHVNISIALLLLTSIPIMMSLSKTIYANHLHTIKNYESLENTVSKLYLNSITDSLTNIFNRRYFFEVAQHSIALTQRDGRTLSLLIFDIDFFKKINDTYGHQAGDTVLITLAQKIKSVVREGDIFARIGGEEFALLLQNSSLQEAKDIAEKLRLMIEKTPFIHNEKSLNITVSIGVSSSKKDTVFSLEALYESADIQLYKAKESGRNRVCASYIT